MKWAILFLAVVLCSCSIALPNEQETLVRQAADAYTQNNFNTAVNAYSTLVAHGFYSPEVFFNRAVAYFQLKNYELALADFRQVQILRPRDPEATKYVEVCRVALSLPVSTRTLTLLSVDECLILALIFWILGWILFMGRFIFSITRNKALIPVITLFFLIAVGLFVLCTTVYTTEIGVIIDNAPARLSPDDRMVMITEVDVGTEVQIVERRGQWVRIMLPNERQAWITQSAVQSLVKATLF